MKRSNWLVADYGIRPAGKPDRCFYCDQPIAAEHKPSCVIRSRTVVVDFTVRLVIDQPESFTPESIEFRFNESTFCMDNFAQMLEDAIEKRPGCLCGAIKAKFVREATAEDERESGVFAKDLPA